MLAMTLRTRIDCFAHAYAIALRLREERGAHQFIIRSACPLQPVRVSATPPTPSEQLMALIA